MLNLRKFSLLSVHAQTDDYARGVLSGLGSVFIEIVYIVLVVIVGVNLLKRGSFYQLLKQAGEEDKTNSQVANVVGIIIYGIIAFLLLPLVKGFAKRILG